MNAQQKLIQYLDEALATEQALTRTLQAHIAMTPAGDYRSSLERHLTETKGHADRLRRRLEELGRGKGGLVGTGVGALQSLVGQVLALGKGPIDMLRGTSGAEELLKNAKDECASEALEIATYHALEHFARRIGDEQTGDLAASIRSDEERMLAELTNHLSPLVDDVAAAELEGKDVYDASTTGAAQAARGARDTARGAASRARSKARSTGRRAQAKAEQTAERAQQRAGEAAAKAEGRAQREAERAQVGAAAAGDRAQSAAGSTAKRARAVPGVTEAEGAVRGATASEGDLAIADYDNKTVDDIEQRLAGLTQVQLGMIDAYERRHENRSTLLERIESLRGDEPWSGYDEQTVADIRKALAVAEADKVREVRDYERRHKERKGVLDAVDSQLDSASAS
jgi:ferritin-like metal-binding protein YciE